MADPQKYHRGYSFSGYQATNPKQPLPGPRVDDELENIELSIGETIDALEDIRRSDGQLKNGIVTEDSLAPGLLEVIQGAVKTLYDQAVAMLALAAEYLAEMTTAHDQTLVARDEAVDAAGSAASYATMIKAYLYDFNLGGDVADPDWNN